MSTQKLRHLHAFHCVDVVDDELLASIAMECIEAIAAQQLKDVTRRFHLERIARYACHNLDLPFSGDSPELR